jgi:hypothetical protein
MAGAMARARLLPDALLESKEFSALQNDSALAFLMLLPHWDRDGLLDGDAAWELPKLMHYRDELSKRMVAFVENWERVGLITSYGVAGRKILYWRKFRIYNANIVTSREAPSRYPPPPGYTRDESGLIPEDENDIQDLIFQLDPRSTYRIALERALTLKLGRVPFPYGKGHHDNSLSNHDLSLRGRADQQDQDQYAVAVDQSIHSSLVKVTGGTGGEMAARQNYKIESLGQLDHRQLVAVAMYAGAGLGLLDDWVGYLDHLITLTETGLNTLIRWIAFYSVLTPEQMARVNSFTAVIRANINEGRHPSISAKMRDFIDDITEKVLSKEQ